MDEQAELRLRFRERERARHKTARDFVAALPLATPSDNEDRPLDECFCFEVYEGTTHVAVRTPCNHVFGRSCLTSWCVTSAATSNKCPICRAVMFDDGRSIIEGRMGEIREQELRQLMRQFNQYNETTRQITRQLNESQTFSRGPRPSLRPPPGFENHLLRHGSNRSQEEPRVEQLRQRRGATQSTETQLQSPSGMQRLSNSQGSVVVEAHRHRVRRDRGEPYDPELIARADRLLGIAPEIRQHRGQETQEYRVLPPTQLALPQEFTWHRIPTWRIRTSPNVPGDGASSGPPRGNANPSRNSARSVQEQERDELQRRRRHYRELLKDLNAQGVRFAQHERELRHEIQGTLDEIEAQLSPQAATYLAVAEDLTRRGSGNEVEPRRAAEPEGHAFYPGTGRQDGLDPRGRTQYPTIVEMQRVERQRQMIDAMRQEGQRQEVLINSLRQEREELQKAEEQLQKALDSLRQAEERRDELVRNRQDLGRFWDPRELWQQMEEQRREAREALRQAEARRDTIEQERDQRRERLWLSVTDRRRNNQGEDHEHRGDREPSLD
ncbi:hypothetical protein DM02DRAFT_634997 [Periconia macrospinosa]|uniref:RING-type domain-containing protein n=1 Tax=Periconia macrospinosa TaxID=97972 RepID=A0A2V1D4H9_9PLEO|nr:hypothetical protein DM02DRAFT_634997 [Periconia macrospinosa]